MPPLMFGTMIIFMLIGFPVAFSLAAVGLVLRRPRHFHRSFRSGLPAGAAVPLLRHHLQRPAAGDSVLHLHGRDPRALRPGRRPARRHRPAVRQGPRRPRLCRDPRRRRARRHHRHGRGLGHRHGRDLAADHDALRLRHEARHRRHRRVRHDHAVDPAVAGADRAGRPARPLGRRHVSRRDRSLDPAGRDLHPLHRRAVDPAARTSMPPLPEEPASR